MGGIGVGTGAGTGAGAGGVGTGTGTRGGTTGVRVDRDLIEVSYYVQIKDI